MLISVGRQKLEQVVVSTTLGGDSMDFYAVSERSLGENDHDAQIAEDALRAETKHWGWRFIPRYSSLSDLVASIRSDLYHRDTRDCLRNLEIKAHGSPFSINGVSSASISEFVSYLLSIKPKLCDEVHIYFSGCNTGLRLGFVKSIAEKVAEAFPAYDPNDFNVHVSVYGTTGYTRLGDSIMGHNMKTEANPVKDGKFYPPYPGAKDASNINDCFNEFKNY